MKRINEYIRIDPIGAAFTTAAGTTVNLLRINNNDNVMVRCFVKCGTVATGITATAANYIQFSVVEATAASAAGSAISGATVTLGAATAAQARGLTRALLRVTSNLTTATEVQINGITYRTTLTGVGSSGEAVAAQLASAINGKATSEKLPHYRAVANYTDTGVVLIEPDDDAATGLTIITTAAAATIVPLMLELQGAISIARSKFSTNTPKYIGVSWTTFNGATNVVICDAVRRPTYSPAFPGRVIQLDT